MLGIRMVAHRMDSMFLPARPPKSLACKHSL
jgi:hypothetical protein